MDQGSRKKPGAHEEKPVSLGEWMHERARGAIEMAVEEELAAALGAAVCERTDARRGYRDGQRARTLTGRPDRRRSRSPRGAVLAAAGGGTEWASTILPRYQRRLREANEAVVAIYLDGGNTRRIRGTLAPLLKAAPLSKGDVSRIVATLKDELAAWRTRSLAEVDAIYLYLDAFTLRVRSARSLTSPARALMRWASSVSRTLTRMIRCSSRVSSLMRPPPTPATPTSARSLPLRPTRVLGVRQAPIERPHAGPVE